MKTIRLGNSEFEGRNNVYLLDSSSELVLVDTGSAEDQVQRNLTDGLAQHGYEYHDIDALLLTHWHYDHAGLAGFVQERSDATVYAHERDAELIRQEPDSLKRYRMKQNELFRKWGIPQDQLVEVRDHLEGMEESAGIPATVEPLEDGQQLDFDGLVLEAIHTPGHTAGHCCFTFDTKGGESAFVGDALLPVYTPNVGGTDARHTRPLEQYLDTLSVLADLDLEQAFPGHRHRITDPTERANAIVAHHRERTKRVLDILAERGPSDVWTVCKKLFGDLDGIHVVHGAGEAYAHLDHLQRNGVVAETAATYRLGETEPDFDSLFPGGS